MKYYEQTWSIPSHLDWELRWKKISPIKLMSMGMTLGGNSTKGELDEQMKMNAALITFALESAEYKIINTWFPVKVEGEDKYHPEDLESDLKAMQEIVAKFLEDVFYPTFLKSAESQKKTK